MCNGKVEVQDKVEGIGQGTGKVRVRIRTRV